MLASVNVPIEKRYCDYPALLPRSCFSSCVTNLNSRLVETKWPCYHSVPSLLSMFRCNAVNPNEQVPVVPAMTPKASKDNSQCLTSSMPFRSRVWRIFLYRLLDPVDETSNSHSAFPLICCYISARCLVLLGFLVLVVSVSSIGTAGQSSACMSLLYT